VQPAVFCPKVDEISLLTINTTTGFNPVSFPFLLLSLLEFDFSKKFVLVSTLGGSGGACAVCACGNVGVGGNECAELLMLHWSCPTFFGCSKLELRQINMILVLSVAFLDLVVPWSRSYLELGEGEE
jgi:hypothetical protein